MRAAFAASLLIALAAAAIALRGGGNGGGSVERVPTRNSAATQEPGTGALDGRAPIIGQPAPDFVLRGIDGQLVKLSDLRGKVVWINFWATWCTPCKKELPDIQKMYDEKRDDGLVVLAVNWQDPADTTQSYAEGLGLSMPVLRDPRGSVYDQYKLQGLPDSFFVGRDGNIAALQFGYLTESKMRERLAKAGLP